MKQIYFFLYTAIFFFFLSCGQKKDMSMSFDQEKVHPFETYQNEDGWYRLFGNTTIDTLVQYKGENSLRITPTLQEEDSLKRAFVFYHINLTEIEGKTITLNGKYRCEDVENTTNTKIIITISQSNKESGSLKDSILITPTNQTSRWTDFTIKTPLEKYSPYASVGISIQGNTNLWISNFQLMIDDQPLNRFGNREFAAEKDNEFDNGSNIELGALTPQMIENLEVLGKIWGFLKYYHPQVTQGNYNWDYELFRVLPDIAHAKNKEDRNKLLNRWIDKYGKITETTDYTIKDSAAYSRIIDLSWLEDYSLFDEKLIHKLQSIKKAKRKEKLNYYIVHYQSGLKPVIQKERPYKNIQWEDQGFRILTLFRLWNMIEYCFPYTEYTDRSWRVLLKEFIPRFVVSTDQASYELAIKELGAKIDDSHGNIFIPNSKLSETILSPIYKKNRMPVELTFSQEGDIVIKMTKNSFFDRGDIILSIEGKDINTIIKELKSYIIASNNNGLIKNILPYLLSSDSNRLNVEIVRNGKKMNLTIDHFKTDRKNSGIKSWEEYNLKDKNIIHVDNIKSAEQNRNTVLNIMNSKGIIVDMRQYPNKSTQNSLSLLLLLKHPLWISENDKSFPGNYHVSPGYDNVYETEKDTLYKGKIVILVDEGTISAGETWSMSYRLAPNSLIIGRQTAGANGNICKTYLPGGVLFWFSQLGAYYPHWEILQRKGVKIDIPVSPTANDIKEGRDVWIEKAIEIIEGK